MSYLEFFGTVLNILSVWLVTRKNIWTWPVGIVAVVLFGILFYQIQLYSDLIEQGYFLLTGFYGWWLWLRPGGHDRHVQDADLGVERASRQTRLLTGGIIAAGTASLGYVMQHVHFYFPRLFPLPASFPYLDAFTTVMSFAAQLLMAHKKIESWYLWIVVDVIGIWLYYVKDVKFVSLLYVIFLVLATKGFLTWAAELRKRPVASAP